MKRKTATLVGLAAVGMIGLWLATRGPRGPVETWAAVRGEVTGTELQEVGLLEAKSLARILSPVDGTLAEMAEDGVLVNKGDLLFRIDDESMRGDLENMQTELDLKLEDLERIRAELAVITNSYAHVLEREQAELAHSERVLDHRVQGLPPGDRRLLAIAIERAVLDLTEKEENLARAKDLVDRDFAFASSLDTPTREMEAARAFLAEKRTQLELETQALLEEERLALQAAVDQARDVVQRSGQRHERDVARKRMELEGQTVEIEHLRGRMEDLRKRLEQVRVIAPASGVLRIMRSLNWSTGSWLTLSPGQLTYRLNVLGDILDPNDLQIRVLVHESDIRNVSTGMTARVRLTAFPDQILTGRVEQVTSLGQDRSDLATLYRQTAPSFQAQFLAVIQIGRNRLDLRPGMTATVALEIEAPRPRLLIPREALRSSADPWQVVRRRAGQREDLRIEGGFRRDGWFEVTNGLAEGDDVLLFPGEVP